MKSRFDTLEGSIRLSNGRKSCKKNDKNSLKQNLITPNHSEIKHKSTFKSLYHQNTGKFPDYLYSTVEIEDPIEKNIYEEKINDSREFLNISCDMHHIPDTEIYDFDPYCKSKGTLEKIRSMDKSFL